MKEDTALRTTSVIVSVVIIFSLVKLGVIEEEFVKASIISGLGLIALVFLRIVNGRLW